WRWARGGARSPPPAVALLRPYGETRWCVTHDRLLSRTALSRMVRWRRSRSAVLPGAGVGRSVCPRRPGGRAAFPGGGNDGGERVLRPTLAEPGEKAEDEQRQPPMIRALGGADVNMEKATAEGERDGHREDASDQRPQAAEEERVRAA